MHSNHMLFHVTVRDIVSDPSWAPYILRWLLVGRCRCIYQTPHIRYVHSKHIACPVMILEPGFRKYRDVSHPILVTEKHRS